MKRRQSKFFEHLSRLPILNRMEAKIALKGIYRRSYDLISPTDSKGTMSDIAMLDSMNVRTHDPLFAVVKEFIRNGIYDKTGLSIDEYLNYPPYITGIILEVCSSDTENERMENEKLNKQFDKVLNKD